MKVEQLDEVSLKRLILAYEKKSLKNQEMRMKFPDSPEKFMDSEIDLNDAIQSLTVVATNPELYHVLVETGAVTSLVSLIPHENTDISTAVLNLIQELTDVDTLNEGKEGADVLIDALVSPSSKMNPCDTHCRSRSFLIFFFVFEFFPSSCNSRFAAF